jgi:hypothetical protein
MPEVLTSDSNSNMGSFAQDNGFGYWCQSDDMNAFTVNKM